MYYVYEWYIVGSGEIIYVGKGKGRRYKVKSQRNAFLTDMLKRYNCQSRIIKEFEDEKEAYEFEYDRIQQLKEDGQCVCNIHCGGAGGTGEMWTDELRREYSEKNVMKDARQRKRMSEKNPMKDPETAKRVNSQKRRAVIIDGVRYESLNEVREAFHTSNDCIRNWCKKGITPQGLSCRYEDEEQVTFSDVRYNKGGCKAIVYQGKTYESAIDLAKALGCGVGRIYSWAKRGFSPEGEPCRYLADHDEHIYENRHAIRNRNKAKPVVINGVQYGSCSEASEKLHLKKSTLYAYINGSRSNKKYICEYGNQQPSRGNTDNSTAKGSTTNG